MLDVTGNGIILSLMNSATTTTKTTKIPALKITLIRREGTVREVNEGLAVLLGADVFGQADLALCGWSRTVPREGGYHKCSFVVEYADGETYEGRYDLKAGEGVSIGAHMMAHLEYAVKRGNASAAAFLAGYAVG
jgi:hypothetical protein